MPVAVQGFLIGIITERDILRSVGLGNDPDRTTVNDVMTPDPDYLEPDVTVEDAAEWMLAAGYRHLPIAEDGKILGMVSIKDVLWALTGGTEGRGSLEPKCQPNLNPPRPGRTPAMKPPTEPSDWCWSTTTNWSATASKR